MMNRMNSVKKMKKNSLFILMVTVAAVLLAQTFAPAVLAQPAEEVLFELEEDGELVLFLSWENSRPDVKFISPDGTVYGLWDESPDTRLSAGEHEAYFRIVSAKAGVWKALCDRTADPGLKIERVRVNSMFVIENISLTQLGNTVYEVGFSSSYDELIGYSYRVMLIADGDTSASRLLASGYASSNDYVTVEVDLSQAPSYDGYRIMVEGKFYSGSLEISDSAVSDTFRFVNPDSYLPETEFSVTLMPERFCAAVVWEPGRQTEYLVAVTEDDGSGNKDTQFESFSGSDAGYCEFSFSADAKIVTFGFREKTTDFFSDEKTLSVDLEKLPTVSFVSADATSEREIPAEYARFTTPTEVTFSDGDKKTVVELSGDGSIYLALPGDGLAKMSAEYFLPNGVRVLTEKEVFIDREPPRIEMLQDYTNATTTRETFEIAGTVSGCTELFIGDQKIEFDPEGMFIHTLTLAEGENEFDVTAADAAGNKSLYRVSVTRRTEEAAEGSLSLRERLAQKTADPTLKTLILFSPAILAALIGIALVITALVSWKKKDSRGILKGFRRLFAALSMGSFSFAFYSLTGFLLKKTLASDLDFIDTALDSVEEAAKLLEWENTYFVLFLVGLGAAALFGIAYGAVRLTEKKKGFSKSDKKDKKDSSDKEKKAPRPEKNAKPNGKKKK